MGTTTGGMTTGGMTTGGTITGGRITCGGDVTTGGAGVAGVLEPPHPVSTRIVAVHGTNQRTLPAARIRRQKPVSALAHYRLSADW
jgi:hypothetical protein